MGILQKDRRGTKSAKAPIPVPSFWLERINAAPRNDTASSPQTGSSAAVVVSQLRDQLLLLATSDSDIVTWLDQN
ncbi:hypothetical protein GGF39_003948, partial [Coemansia sp. RSA 1721]